VRPLPHPAQCHMQNMMHAVYTRREAQVSDHQQCRRETLLLEQSYTTLSQLQT
jgi:hypothetical protein